MYEQERWYKSWIFTGKIKQGEVIVWRSGLSGYRRPEELEHLMFTTHLIRGGDEQDPVASIKLDYGEKSLRETLKSVTDAIEKRIIKKAMAEAGGSKSEVVRRLGIDYKTLLRKIKIHGI